MAAIDVIRGLENKVLHMFEYNSWKIYYYICAQVISLYSGGLMTENRNSGVFLIIFMFLSNEDYNIYSKALFSIRENFTALG